MHIADTADESGRTLAGSNPAVQFTPKAKSFRQIERLRGLKEAGTQLALLREKWPYPFAARADRVRPLASSTVLTISEAMGWSPDYCRAVLNVWKNGSAYCQAVLRHDTRVHLDGTPSEERVDDRARKAAQERLAQLAARSRAKAESQRRKEARAAASAPPPFETGEERRDTPGPPNGLAGAKHDTGTTQNLDQTETAPPSVETHSLRSGEAGTPIVVPLSRAIEAHRAPLSAAEEKDKLFRAKMAQLAKRRRR